MRLALLHYTIPPIPGGVERIVAEHAALMARRGHEVTVLAGEGLQGEIHPGVRVQIIPWLKASSAAKSGSDGASEECRTEIRQWLAPYDVIFLHNVLTMPFHPELLQALWNLADLPEESRPILVGWVHDVAAAQPEYQWACLPGEKGERLRRMHPGIRYFAVSEQRREELCRIAGEPLELCTLIPNGFDPLARLPLTKRIRRLAEREAVLDRGLVLLHPARLVRRKNLEWSLRLCHELRARGADPLLLLTAAPDAHQGSGRIYLQELVQMEKDLALSGCVIWAPGREGDLGAADVDSLYALADALVFPSRHEGFGLPLLEAALHRLPIFCSDMAALHAGPGERAAKKGDLEGASDGLRLTTFSLDTPLAAVAREVQRKLDNATAYQQRKYAIRRHGWKAVDQDYLAPLLDSLQAAAGRRHRCLSAFSNTP